MDLEEMKASWESACSNAKDMKDIGNQELCETSHDRLARRYRNFFRLSLVAMFISFINGIHSVSLFGNTPSWLWIAFMAFFMIAAIMDYWLYRSMQGINFNNMTVEEVLHSTMYLRKRHIQFIFILMPLAIFIVVYFAICNKDNAAMAYGIAAGFIIGLTAGIMKLLDFLSDYRNIKNSLE